MVINNDVHILFDLLGMDDDIDFVLVATDMGLSGFSSGGKEGAFVVSVATTLPKPLICSAAFFAACLCGT